MKLSRRYLGTMTQHNEIIDITYPPDDTGTFRQPDDILATRVVVDDAQPNTPVFPRIYFCRACGLPKRGHKCMADVVNILPVQSVGPLTRSRYRRATAAVETPPPQPNRQPHEEFEVEAVLGLRRMGRGWQVLIKWVGYGEEHNEWVARSKCNCDRLIEEYLRTGGDGPVF